MRRPEGIVRFKVFRRGRLLLAVEDHNLFVNAGLPALAALLGGDTTGEFASAIGFGIGTAAPTTGDTGLTTPAYYKALASHSEDGIGDVTLNWTLGAGDSAFYGNTIQELGLFANKTPVTLPGSTAPTPMLARKTIAPIAFAAGVSLVGSWTLTF